MSDRATVFLQAADAARQLLDIPDLAARWTDPSVLERMSVGDLTAHLARAVTNVPRYLTKAAAPPYRDPAGYFLSLAPDLDTDLDSDLAVAVRDRARTEAGSGLGAVRQSWNDAREQLASELTPAVLEYGIAVLGSGMRVGDYLVTRMVELVVHSDDLAVSLGIETPDFDPAVTGPVIECLTEIAALRSSPLEVIRAMTRTERSLPETLRVF